MSRIDRDESCRRLEALLVDYVDGNVGDAERDLVDAHCAECPSCTESLVALREIPSLLLAEQDGEVGPDHWVRQRSEILAAVEEVLEAARPRGFDYRLLLPVAAALLIGLAGLLSLRRPGDDVSVAHVARAAFEIEIADPLVQAEVLDVVGLPIHFSETLWDEAAESDAENGDQSDDPSERLDLGDLEDDEVDEIEDLLGFGSIV